MNLKASTGNEREWKFEDSENMGIGSPQKGKIINLEYCRPSRNWKSEYLEQNQAAGASDFSSQGTVVHTVLGETVFRTEPPLGPGSCVWWRGKSVRNRLCVVLCVSL